ncbi:MAG: hypothetical protein HWE10_12260 [Gammaproteobacteria bacterium]|nr:hypothetical protein [Gammaproteobacteria bacterium]
MRFLIVIIASILAGCSTISNEISAFQKSRIEVIERENYTPRSEEGRLHSHIERLARQLFDTANAIDLNRPVIVGTFLPAKSLQAETNDSIQPYGLQLQESFATFSTQAGLKVIEYKALSSVHVTPNADIMLSRDIQQLSQRVQAEYLLTGTYIQQENSLIVNVRLINILDQSLIAAATDYLPMNSMWSHSKVRTKDQQLYRGEY